MKNGVNSKVKILIGAALATGLAGALLVIYLRVNNVAVLDPAGPIAARERELIITTTILMLVIVLPVFVMTFAIAWRYRAGNKAAEYRPNWDGNRAIELLWWALPLIIITILSVIAWRSSHELDPFKPLVSAKEPVKIQAVALQWKWLFIYPDYGIATVNQTEFPSSTPLNFTITADAPMNSFWIPQLGGMIYAMPGMATKLHLQADEPGIFRGSSANISGSGFAKMNFSARASTNAEFEQWVEGVRQQPYSLTAEQYEKLAQPGTDTQVVYFSSVDKNLFGKILAKYLAPAHSQKAGMEGMSH